MENSNPNHAKLVLIDWEALVKEYVDNPTISARSLALKYGVCKTAVLLQLKNRNIPTNRKHNYKELGKIRNPPPKPQPKFDIIRPEWQSKEWLYDQYIVQQKSYHTIANELKLDPETVRKYLRKFHIPVRTISEASQLAWQNPETINKYREAMAAIPPEEWKDQHKRAGESQRGKIVIVSDEEKAKLSAIQKEKWKSNKYRNA